MQLRSTQYVRDDGPAAYGNRPLPVFLRTVDLCSTPAKTLVAAPTETHLSSLFSIMYIPTLFDLDNVHRQRILKVRKTNNVAESSVFRSRVRHSPVSRQMYTYLFKNIRVPGRYTDRYEPGTF